MRLSRFLLLLGGTGLISSAGWLVVLWFIDPTQTGVLGIVLFYATLGCALFVAVIFAGLVVRLGLRRLQHHSVLAFQVMLPTVRQALWCSLIVLLSLLLASQELFSWFVGLVLVIFFTLLEGFLYSLHKQPHHEPVVTAE